MTATNLTAFAQNSPVVDVKTTLGDFKVLLYDDTPVHRDNFIKNVENGVYDGVLFHRVIKDFMVQAGDPTSKTAGPDAMLGAGDLGTTLPAEIVYPTHYHKYGALAAARTNNPEKRSSDCQFYIVTGRKFPAASLGDRVLQSVRNAYIENKVKENDAELRKIYQEQGRDSVNAIIEKYIHEAESAVTEAPKEILETYSTVGGTPHLDGEYTVFGEVLEGMDVIDKIQNVETGEADRPVQDVRIISMKVEKQGASEVPEPLKYKK